MIPSAATRVGRFLRLPLRLVRPNAEMRVLSGPLAGARWIAGSAPHGCWIGSYERELQQLLVNSLRPGHVFYDVGANVGFFSLLASRKITEQGHVVAVEPLPRNLALLERHLTMNEARNVQVVPAAAADSPGWTVLEVAASPSMGRIDAAEGVRVPVVSLDTLVTSGSARPPDVIKMDIEGAESRALAGAMRVLGEYRPLVFLSTHGIEQHEHCCAVLESIGYSVRMRRDGHHDGQYEVVAS